MEKLKSGPDPEPRVSPAETKTETETESAQPRKGSSEYHLTEEEAELIAQLQLESAKVLRADVGDADPELDACAASPSGKKDESCSSPKRTSEVAHALSQALEELAVTKTTDVISDAQKSTAATIEGMLVRLRNFNAFSAKALPNVLSEIGPCLARVQTMKKKMEDVTLRLQMLRSKAEKCWVPSSIVEEKTGEE